MFKKKIILVTHQHSVSKFTNLMLHLKKKKMKQGAYEWENTCYNL